MHAPTGREEEEEEENWVDRSNHEIQFHFFFLRLLSQEYTRVLTEKHRTQFVCVCVCAV